MLQIIQSRESEINLAATILNAFLSLKVIFKKFEEIFVVVRGFKFEKHEKLMTVE